MIDIQEEIRPIPGFDGYSISKSGNIYSYKCCKVKELIPFTSTTSKYLQIRLTNNAGKSKYCLVHRLVAITYIPNPNNLPEVNHKDKNILNNHVDNLEWCTRKQNLNDSYSTMSPTRNYCLARLYKNDELIGEFKGIAKAARYAHDKFGVSESGLIKYLKCGEYEIKADTNGKYNYQNHPQTSRQNRNPIRLYKNGYFQKEFKTMVELESYFRNELNIQVKDRSLHRHCNTGKEYKGYLIKRAI